MAKYNRLISRAQRAANFGGPAIDETRRTGLSTAIALRALASAILQPGVPIKVIDHVDTQIAHHCTLARCSEISLKLGLKHLSFNADNCTVTAYIWTDNQWSIT